VEQVAQEGLLVLSETDYRVLKGHVVFLAPFLTGAYTVDEIVDRLQGEIPAAELYYTLMQLEQHGYLVEGESTLPDREAAYWDSLAAETNLAEERLNGARVGVTTSGAVSAEPLIAVFDTLHVQIGEKPDLEIVITDDYLNDSLEVFNREQVQQRRPYLLVKPVGTITWLGPLVIPGKTGCWACLAQRLHLNRPALTFLRQRDGTAGSVQLPIASLHSTECTTLQLAATEVAKWIVLGKNDTLEGKLVAFDTRTLESRSHVLTHRPQCPHCGNPPESRDYTPTPPELVSRKKGFTEDGGHRFVPPDVTNRDYTHHISPITGVVRRLERLSDADNHLVFSYTAGYNPASLFEDYELVRKNLRNLSGGKGRTDVQARASGLCEALERHCGIYQGDEATHISTYRALFPEAIHPNECMSFSERQYRDRETLNEEAVTVAQRIPEPFDEDAEIEWAPAWSLTEKTFKYLPMAYCYYGYPPDKSAYCRADSNGNAAGNTLEEAILQGFMELVERDGVALWWYNRYRVPGVDLAGFDEPYFEELKAYYQSIDRSLWVLDVTTDLEIPAFVAVSRRKDRLREDILFGFGAHFDARMGVLRALTEMNQILPGVLDTRDDDQGRPIHPDHLAVEWWMKATLDNQPYLLPRKDTPSRTSADYPRCWSDDLLEDVNTCQEIIEQKGMEMLVLDQTRPDIGLPVVKVLVPGLRHYWPRFGPGRLYDVPVQLCVLREPLQEQQLNPFPIFF